MWGRLDKKTHDLKILTIFKEGGHTKKNKGYRIKFDQIRMNLLLTDISVKSPTQCTDMKKPVLSYIS